MPETDERLAEHCANVWLQLRDLDPYDILVVLTALLGNVIRHHDNPEPLLKDACAMLAHFATQRCGPREPG